MRRDPLLPLALIALAAAPRPVAGLQEAPMPVPRAESGGPRITLDRLEDPIALERSLREALERQQPLRLTVPGGLVRLGAFSIGTLDTLRVHLLVLRGQASVYGRVEGNVVALDGDVVVHPGGSIAGDVAALGGRVIAPEGAVTGLVHSLGRLPSLPRPDRRLSFGERLLGLTGLFLALGVVGFGLVTFARPALETVSDTVTHSLPRAFVVGLLAEILAVPTFGMLVVGLALTVVGIVLIPFAVVAYLLLLTACLVLGLLAVAHAMGETYTRRRLALGVVLSPNSYRYVGVGLVGLAAVWAVWGLFGWVPVAGTLVLGAAVVTTWLLLTVGIGASILSRVGARHDFAGRFVPPEALTDEYLWATPQLGVPAAKRPEGKGRVDG